MSESPWDRYRHAGLAKIWYSEEGVGAYSYQHQVLIAIAEAQEELGMIKVGTAAAVKRVEVDLNRIVQIQKEGENHQTRAYIKMVQEKMRANGDHEFLAGVYLWITSFDLWDTGLGLMLPASADVLISDELMIFEGNLLELAVKHKHTLMMGRSHGIHGKPITFGKKCLDWLHRVELAHERLVEASQRVAIGKISGAMGIYSQTSKVEELVCRKLGLTPAKTSTQIIDRSVYADFFNAVVLVATAMESIALTIRSLQRTEIGELEEPFTGTGSTAMPHKRNPELCERVCGLARKVRHDQGVLYENIATWDERSLEQSSAERITFSEMFVLTGYVCWIMNAVIRGLTVHPERMLRNIELTNGAIYSEDVKIYLQERGVDQNTAYEMVKGPGQAAYGGSKFLDVFLESEAVANLGWTQEQLEELRALFDPRSAYKYLDEIYVRFGL